jgi:hypothetical protein
MPRIIRLSDLIEIHSEYAIYYGFGGLVAASLSGLLFNYRGASGMFVPLAVMLLLIGLGLIFIATRSVWRVRNIVGHGVECPFCQERNELLSQPTDDFACVKCNRMIPIIDGNVVPVHQVRCGFCNELNFYSEKTDALLCENCNHEIPIATEEGRSVKAIPKAYTVIDDEALYELILVSHGQHKYEELIAALQHMLALNRNQVKQMLDELPVTILSGITRQKAEMLRAQLSLYEGLVEFRSLA